MSATDILLIGAGGHALSCIEVIEHGGRFRIVGLVGSEEERGTSVLGYPVMGTDADLSDLRRRCRHALIAVGQLRSPSVRMRLFAQARDAGFDLPAIIAADATVSRHADVGDGSIVMHGAIVNAGARVGENCILNSRCLVEHGARVGNHCHIATGAIVNGDAAVGEGSLLGSASVLREGRCIGRDCLVGMGLTVRSDLPDGCHFMGHGKGRQA
jgi:sugar O-acyltransferase (sialic acid O-acetyltransferase NeuD family)